jgi:uncharacterized membrane protein YhaH (DUF805 family)
MIKKILFGRINRVEFFIANFLVNLPISIFGFYYFKNYRYDLAVYLWLIFGVSFLVLFLLILSRLRDMGKSGWWSLMFFLPAFNLVFLIILFFYPGSKEKE